jgi:UDP-N-acetylmuramyl pentapeptide synthase
MDQIDHNKIRIIRARFEGEKRRANGKVVIDELYNRNFRKLV